jgi:hypothetical protein
MKMVAVMIAMLVLMFLVSKQMSGLPGGPSVKVPQVELPKGAQEAMNKAASGAANNAQATVNAVGAAANQVLQDGAAQTAEKLKAAEAAQK